MTPLFQTVGISSDAENDQRASKRRHRDDTRNGRCRRHRGSSRKHSLSSTSMSFVSTSSSDSTDTDYLLVILQVQ